MSVRTRIIGACLVAFCLAAAAHERLALAQKAKPQPAAAPRAATAAPAKKATPKPAPKGAALDLNTATAAQLDDLPGIGAKTAQRIIEYRQKVGGFKKIEQLMNVRGVGEKNFLKLKDRITVGKAVSAGVVHQPSPV